MPISNSNRIKQMQDLAISNNGKLISTVWEGIDTRYLFSWEDGRQFTITYRYLTKRGWPTDLDSFLKLSNSFLRDPSIYLEELKNFACKNNLHLITQEWQGQHYRYCFRFSNLEEVYFSYNYIKKNGFPKDLKKYIDHTNSLMRTDIEKFNIIKEIAKKHKGKLLSTEWIGDKAKHFFEFEDGTTFEVTPFYLKKNGWPINQQDYLKRSLSYKKTNENLYEELKLLAENNNGKLIDKEWKGGNEKYLFQFSDGGYFEAQPGYLKNQGWPKDPKLFLKRSKEFNKTSEDFLREMQEIAKINKCELISRDWKGAKGIYQFRSEKGQLFELSYRYLKEHGCPKDVEEYLYLSNRHSMSDQERLEELNKIAITHGGKLLSKEWLGSKFKYEFQDQCGVNFFCYPQDIMNGQWSPDRGLISEPICRQVMEHLFKNKFIKNRKVLNAELTGRSKPLELDGYCKELNIAFEYQGYPSHWDKNHKNYHDTKEKDDLKEVLCNKLGIILIKIDCFDRNTNRKLESTKILNHILKNIEETYKKLNLEIPLLNKEPFVIDTSKIHHGSDMLKQLSDIAKNNNAVLLSKKWRGPDATYLFKCENEYTFEITWAYLRESGWPKDPLGYTHRSQLMNKTLEERMEELRNIAAKNNGKVISKEWFGASEKHCFQFEDGRLFYVSPDYMKDVGWPKDPNSYFDRSDWLQKSDEQLLQDLQDIAIKNGGKLISATWLGDMHKYLWEFNDGRQFQMSGRNIKKNWPKDPNLFFKLRKAHTKTPEERMEELRSIALENNGKVISEEWLGTEKPYILEFSDGRQFKMSLEKLRANGWPKNPDKYLKNSQIRAKHLTKDVLFSNFKNMVSSKLNGTVLETEWLGSKIEHAILMQDGKTIFITPNKLKSLN